MSITAAQLIAKVGVEGSDKAKSDLQSVGGAVTSAGGIFKSALGGPIALAAGIAGKAFSFLKDQTVDAIKIAMAHQSVMAQTAQAIKSTGDASGLSAGQIGDMATSLSKVTPFSEDAIQSGQNLLLTFTGIGKQAFPLATKAMIDLSQAMGQDMKSSAIQLGKALNDPLTGMSALQRVGVTFSATEKEQIKTMMAHNDVLGAQKVMLKELNTEFGGSAQAAGKTLAGALAILKNNFDDLKEKVGSAVIPIFSNLVGMLNTDVLPLFDKLGPIIGSVVNYFKSFDLTPITYAWHQLVITIEDILDPLNTGKADLSALSPILNTLKNGFSQLMVSGIRDVGNFIQFIATAIKNISNGQGGAVFNGLSSAVKEFAPLIQHVGQLMGGELLREFRDIGAAAQQVGQWFMSSVVPAIKQAMPGFESLGKTILTTVIPAFIQIRGVVMDVVEHAFKTFGPIIEKLIPPLIVLSGQIAGGLAQALKFIMPYVVQAAQAIGKFADEIMDRVAPIIKNWIAQMTSDLSIFRGVWSAIWPTLSQILKGVWDMIVGTVKIAWAILSGGIKIGLDVLSGNWKGAWNDMLNMFRGIWDGMKSYLSGAKEIIIGMVSGLVSGLVSIFGQAPGRVGSAISGIISTVGGVLSSAASAAWNGGMNIVNQIANGIRAAIGAVGDAIGSVTQFISDHLPHSPAKIGPLRDLEYSGSQISAQLAQGMQKSLPTMQTSMNMILSPLMRPTQSSGFAGGSAAARSSPATTSASTQPINLQIDGTTFARLFMPYFVDQARYGVGVKF